MILLMRGLWVGDAMDEAHADLENLGVGGLLNVAQDLEGTRGWSHGYEYMQVGLIDGPGNPMSAYRAAVLALSVMLRRHDTLVYCHSGGRSLAVALMCLNMTAGREWDDLMTLMGERVEGYLPVPHQAHRQAFEAMDFDLLSKAAEE